MALKRRTQSVFQNAQGSSLPLSAMVVGALVASAAAAGDLGMWRLQDARLQETVDSTALTLARAVADGVRDPVRLQALGVAEGETAGFLRSDGAEYSITLNPATNDVNVHARYPAERLFGKAMGLAPTHMEAEASAGSGLEGVPLCLIALGETASKPWGVRMDNDVDFIADGCRVHSNRVTGESISVVYEAALTAPAICAVGSNVKVGSDATVVTEPQANCEPAPDPLGHIPEPAWPTTGCIDNPVNTSNRNEMVNLTPGYYCNGITISQGRDVTFAPGTYFVEGNFSMDAHGPDVVAEDITFIVSGNIDIQAYQNITFKAPETGPLAGVVIWRTTTTSCDRGRIRIRKRTSTDIEIKFGGAVYAPTCPLEMSGDGLTLGTPDDSFTLIATHRQRFNNDLKVNINANRTYGEPICRPAGAGAVKLRSSPSTT